MFQRERIARISEVMDSMARLRKQKHIGAQIGELDQLGELHELVHNFQWDFFDTERDKRPREGFSFFEFPTPAEAERKIKRMMEKNPHLTLGEASLCCIYSGTKEWSNISVNTSGGGRYTEYLDMLESKYKQRIKY